MPAGTDAAAAAGAAGTKRVNYKVKVQSVNHVSPACGQ